MSLIKKSLLFAITLFLCFSNLIGAESPQVQASLIAEETTIQPGRPFWVAVRLELAPHWHAYWKNPGDAGMPVQIEWDLPPQFTVGELEWPYPKKMELSGIIGFGYDDELTLLAQIVPDVSVDPNESVDIGAKARWLSCSDAECVPGNAKLSLQIPVSSKEPVINSINASIFTRARENLPELPNAVLVTRENNQLNLFVTLDHLAGAANPENVQFEFYPETKKLIDYRHENGVLSSDGTTALSLNELKKGSSLKGILVAKDGQTSRAFHVDAPIQKNSDNEIAVADIHPSEIHPQNRAISETESEISGFWMALLFAFVGGVILNFMPCVLPVISFKILSFVKMAKDSRAVTIKHSLSFSMGVLLSFWVLATLLLILRSYGNNVGWGFQLQEPVFVGILAGLMFLLSLNLLGVFELGMSLASWAGQVEHTTKKEAPEGLFTSFCSGVLATALATPCTGPFLGSALGYAVTLPSYQALLIFTSLGLGMASPYLLIGIFPSMLRFLPKPGAWMETFKQLMGFLVMASVIWLVWVFAAQTQTIAVVMLLAAFYLIGIGSWIYGKWSIPSMKRSSRIISSLLALSLLVGSIQIVNFASKLAVANAGQTNELADGWEPYSAARVEELQKNGTPVLIDFTAKWCLICQVNHLVLSSEEISSKLASLGVVKMKADWTLNDPEITDALTKYGRNSVPLYLLFNTDSNAPPVILPQVLTPDIVMEELEKIDNVTQKAEAV